MAKCKQNVNKWKQTKTKCKQNFKYVTNENKCNVNKNFFELNFRTDQAINDVIADKIYTSAEFKKVKEIFMVRHFIRLGSTNLVVILG